jgi:hypothetical protein
VKPIFGMSGARKHGGVRAVVGVLAMSNLLRMVKKELRVTSTMQRKAPFRIAPAQN